MARKVGEQVATWCWYKHFTSHYAERPATHRPSAASTCVLFGHRVLYECRLLIQSKKKTKTKNWSLYKNVSFWFLLKRS